MQRQSFHQNKIKKKLVNEPDRFLATTVSTKHEEGKALLRPEIGGDRKLLPLFPTDDGREREFDPDALRWWCFFKITPTITVVF